MVKGHTPAQDRIDKKIFEAFCGLWCTETEIAHYFDVDEDTLNAWCKKTYDCTFSDTYKRFKDIGNASLRADQRKLAKKSATMAIWLGKQYLGQTDEVENNITFEQPELKIEVVDNSYLKGELYKNE